MTWTINDNASWTYCSRHINRHFEWAENTPSDSLRTLPMTVRLSALVCFTCAKHGTFEAEPTVQRKVPDLTKTTPVPEHQTTPFKVKPGEVRRRNW